MFLVHDEMQFNWKDHKWSRDRCEETTTETMFIVRANEESAVSKTNEERNLIQFQVPSQKVCWSVATVVITKSKAQVISTLTVIHSFISNNLCFLLNFLTYFITFFTLSNMPSCLNIQQLTLEDIDQLHSQKNWAKIQEVAFEVARMSRTVAGQPLGCQSEHLWWSW